MLHEVQKVGVKHLIVRYTAVYCYALDWGEGRTNIPDCRVDVLLILPHPEPLNQVEEGK